MDNRIPRVRKTAALRLRHVWLRIFCLSAFFRVGFAPEQSR